MNPNVMSPEETTQAIQSIESEKEASLNVVSLADEKPHFSTNLAASISADWQKNRDNRIRVDHEMLECLRERKGEYGQDELALIRAQGGSDIYIKTATGKIRAGIAHIKSVMLPAGDRAHGIEPTKNPTLPPFIEERIQERIMSNPNMVDEMGNPIPIEDQIDTLLQLAKAEMRKWSADACGRMERKINDQLDEGGWTRAMSDFIDDVCTYPAAFLRGPYMSVEPKLKYQLGVNGTELVSSLEKTWKFRTINPFDAYPAPGVDSVQKGAFIERLRMSKKDLYRMRDVDGYNKDAIEKVMRDQASGHLENWLWTDTARNNIANHNHFWTKSTSDLDGIHWFSSTQGLDLLQWGMNPKYIPDPLDYYEVDAILIGTEVVKATINPDPKYRRAIHSSAYERIPGNVFGNSVSMLMRSTGRMINATARALQNNQAHASGFQVEVNHRRLSPETQAHTHYPFKVWQTEESEQATNGAPAVRFFQPSSNANELMGTIGFFLNLADSDTGIPSVLQGGQGSTDGADGTAKGRGYLLSSAAKLLRSSIGNIDEDVVVPVIEMMYDYNMLFDPDESIKSDAQVVARGANEMLQRETARQEHMAMLEITNNPTDSTIIGVKGRAHLLKKTLNTFDNIDGDHVIPSGEEFDRHVHAIENAPPPPNPELIKIEQQAMFEQGKLDVEKGRLELQAQLQSEKLAAERLIKQMELATQEKVSADDLQKSVQNEVLKLRSARMSERQRAQMDVKVLKMKAEHEARLKVAELKASQRSGQEDTSELSEEDVARVVSETVQPMFQQFSEQTGAIIDSIVAGIQTEQVTKDVQPINVSVHMPNTSKKMTFSKDPSTGDMVGTSVPE